MDFLPTLISEKKFINVFEKLTIFIEKYDHSGIIEKIFIHEEINENSSKIIISEKAKIIKLDNKYKIKLLNGSIANINEKNIYNINFKETEYDLSKFTTKTTTYTKVQEINSLQLLKCFSNHNLYINVKFKHICERRKIKSLSQEIFKRFVVPLYIFILSLVSSTLVIKPKKKKIYKILQIYDFFIWLFHYNYFTNKF